MSRPVDARKELFRASKQRSRDRRTRLAIFSTVSIVFILVLFVGLLYLPALRISMVTAGGATSEASQIAAAFVTNKLAGNSLLIIPNNNTFLVSSRGLEAQVLATFPDIDQVTVERVGFSGLAVSVTERAPTLLWCTGGDNDQCFYTDRSGFLFAEAPQFSDNVMMKIYGLLGSAPIGTRPLAREVFDNLLSITTSLPTLFKTIGMEQAVSKRLTIDTYGDVRVTIAGTVEASTASSTPTWDLLFNQTQSLTDISSTLRTVFAAPEFQADLAAYEGRLDYIDVRFGKKVFYTFK